MSDSEECLAENPYTRDVLTTNGTEIAYVDTGGDDPPVVFIHGNPTSSYLWRNIIPHVEPKARCLAPDLVGYGDSDPAPDACYRFFDHAQYLDVWFEKLDLTEDVTLVIHDWGGALGFWRAYRFPEQIRAMVHMEPVLLPWSYDDFSSEFAADFVRRMRGQEGIPDILRERRTVEEFIPQGTIRDMTDREMEHYRSPFREPGVSRLPMLNFPRELPIEGEPADVHEKMVATSEWLSTTKDLPKLLVNPDPGLIMDGEGPDEEYFRALPNQREVTVDGIHFVQEDVPHAIGEAIATFLDDLPGD